MLIYVNVILTIILSIDAVVENSSFLRVVCSHVFARWKRVFEFVLPCNQFLLKISLTYGRRRRKTNSEISLFLFICQKIEIEAIRSCLYSQFTIFRLTNHETNNPTKHVFFGHWASCFFCWFFNYFCSIKITKSQKIADAKSLYKKLG